MTAVRAFVRTIAPFSLAGGRPAEPGEEVLVDDQKDARHFESGALVLIGPADDGLQKLNRSELDELAAEEGIDDPSSVPNIPALIDAIRAARAAANAHPED